MIAGPMARALSGLSAVAGTSGGALGAGEGAEPRRVWASAALVSGSTATRMRHIFWIMEPRGYLRTGAGVSTARTSARSSIQSVPLEPGARFDSSTWT